MYLKKWRIGDIESAGHAKKNGFKTRNPKWKHYKHGCYILKVRLKYFW